MRIVVPTVDPHPLAVAAVDRLVPEAERVDVSARDNAYWRLLCDLWEAGESFLVIEQDVEPTEQALRQAKSCPCLWGVVIAYGPGAVEFDGSLSFAWFRSSFIRSQPGFMEAAGGWKDMPAEPLGHWRSMDTKIYGSLRESGHRPHVHRPAVPHHHVYAGKCSCRGDHPLYAHDREGRYTS